jgi:hypothetical protein
MQPVDTGMRRIACDNSPVDSSDRYTGDPGWMNARFRQGLVDSRLIGAKRTATLQNQGDAFERKMSFFRCDKREKLNIHGMISIL